jgi:hypothetical protein
MVAFRRIPGLRGIVADLDRLIDKRAAALIEPLREELPHLREQIEQLRWDLDSITPHLAALEIRFADRDFEERLERAGFDPAERALVELVETEHRRISARLQAVSHYEERLRRLEAGLGS